ncbi:ABC transporter substrate-binding protein [Acetatifactor aquisgranensis]|uniref:ABC transporter substrate-binding protein n=1 Tax=Acetatifactor aquisgranensis TaxID=2941233 RepID=UPI00203F89ED|nr:extracellular solute-binding protein [Acetatifactor aquisgranensis]
MRKRKKSIKRTAVLLAAAFLAGALGGCGRQAAGGDEGAGGSENAAASGAENKGRYVEIQEKLPEELGGWEIMQMYSVNEKLRFLTSRTEDGKTALREWEKQGENLTDVTQSWLASMELTALGDWLEARLIQGKDGGQYLYAGYVAEDEENYMGHLWKSDGETAVEITPEKWAIPNEEYGSYEMIQGLAALDNGTLTVLSYSSLDILSGEDGRVIESERLDSYYEGGVISDGENVYLCSSDESGGRIEKRPEGKSDGAAMIPCPSADSSQSGDDTVFSFGGASGRALAALPDGTLIAGGEDGLFRMKAGEEQWEMLMSGTETSFSISDCWCKDFAAFQDGSVYALFQEEDGQALYRYEYDPEAVSQVTEVLKLYTVFENSLLKQAAAKYHKAHPEVLVEIESVYPMYNNGETDYNAVYQELNTMLMGDDAPDMVVMDHLNMDSYAEKGLLADLDDVVRPMEESGELLSNITGVYAREDGKRYAVPLQFGVNLVLGRDIGVRDMSTMEALAGFLAGTDEPYMSPQTAADLVNKFYPYFCDEIVDGKQLDREALGKYLEYLKAIGDNCGVIAARPEGEVDYGIFDLTKKAKLAFNGTAGFTDCMLPMSMADYIKGDFAAFENSFEPLVQAGICAKSQHIDTAKDFLRFALSEEIQDSEYNGFPVNRNSMETQAAKDRSEFTMVTSLEAGDGDYIQFESKAYPKETADRLVAMCQALDKSVGEDAKICEVLTENLGGYLDGSRSKEDTIQKIEDSLKMYLAE